MSDLQRPIRSNVFGYLHLLLSVFIRTSMGFTFEWASKDSVLFRFLLMLNILFLLENDRMLEFYLSCFCVTLSINLEDITLRWWVILLFCSTFCFMSIFYFTLEVSYFTLLKRDSSWVLISLSLWWSESIVWFFMVDNFSLKSDALFGLSGLSIYLIGLL